VHDTINAVGATEITEPSRDGRRFRVTVEHVIDGAVTATGSIDVTIPDSPKWASGDAVIAEVLRTVEAASDSLPNDGRKLSNLRAVDRHHLTEPDERPSSALFD
jgi:hypothetical protein